MKSKKNLLIVKILGICALLIPLVNLTLALIFKQGVNIPLSLVPNFMILVSSYIIRFSIIDISSLEARIIETCGKEQLCCIRRYVDFLLIAMHAGVAATIGIYINFLAGAFIYLIMQILLIIAFSGIISHNFTYSKRISNKLFLFLYGLFWIVLVHVLFFLFAMGAPGSLVLLPYGYALGSMTAISLLGLFYTKRSLVFRLMPAFGAVIFLFSDICIVLAGPERRAPFVYLVNPTYVLAIFLLCYSQLFFAPARGKKQPL